MSWLERESPLSASAIALERAKKAMSPVSARVTVVEEGRSIALDVVRVGVGPLITEHGPFSQYEFQISDRWRDYTAIVRAEMDERLQPIFRSRELLLRIDSGCTTGQVYGDLACDCAEQLNRALAAIAANGEGLVVHIPSQDGRGLGLAFKLGTLALQTELRIDTVEASALLDPDGVTRDQRSFGGVIAILRFFGQSAEAPIRVLSNNPKKLAIFSENGFTDARLSAITIPPTEHTYRHLAAKQRHLGHIGLVAADRVDVDEQQSAAPSEKEESLPIPT